MIGKPYILEETGDYAVVFKPPKMHSVPLKQKGGDTLIDWHAEGRRLDNGLADGGLVHRLDFETHGLALFAKNPKSFEFFKDLQERGEFAKEYSAVCENTINTLPGFPPPPVFLNSSPSPDKPLIISSYFRPFGPGRKQVRPVIDGGKKHHEIARDNGGFYRTEITGKGGCRNFTLRIKRGFRHQIRCHLCWIGCPILGDPLYSQIQSNEQEQPLALRSHALFFTDPSTGKKREYRIDSIS
jgi:23S rRNA pseudouridine1911/1915/1917 synthase